MRKNLGLVSLLLAMLLSCTALAACDNQTGGTQNQKEGTKPLTFLAVNDLHGKFMDTASQPGLDEFSTYLKEQYEDPAREEILLSSGDMWQGSAESSSNKGALMTEWMNDVGFVSMTLGNHEFDWGTEAIASNAELAEFPILGINVTYNGAAAEFCKPSVVVEKGGWKVGIIGAIGDCLSSVSGEFQTGLHFATGGELTALVKKEATRLREEEKCDFIVYSIHDGGDSFKSSGITQVKNSDLPWYDTSLSNGYVDLVFEAHSHYRYIVQDEYGVYHLQAGGENGYIGSVAVAFPKGSDPVVTPKLLSTSVYADDSLVDDPIVETLFQKYCGENDPYTVIGTNSSKWSSSDLCDKVAELYYKKGVETWGSQYPITLGGGFLKARKPYDLAKGNVTYADIYSILPFDNAIVLGEIRGNYLKSNFIKKKENYHTYYQGQLSESDIDDNETYYIIVDSYTSTYRPNHITEVARLDGNIFARDLIAAYIKDGRRA